MKTRLLTTAIAATLCSALAQNPPPAAPPAAPPTQQNPPATPPLVENKAKLNLLNYKAPKSATGGIRKDGDGASRSGGKWKYPSLLTTLTPKDSAALTTQAQPSLFCYQSEQASMELWISITEAKKSKAVFVIAASSSAAGLHRLNLADYNVTLQPGVEYKWTVVLRPDPTNRSSDLDAFGSIKRIEPDAALAEKLKTTPAPLHAGVYAEAGIWYDALAAVSDQIAANPGDKDLVTLRESMLKAAGVDLTAKASAKANP